MSKQTALDSVWVVAVTVPGDAPTPKDGGREGYGRDVEEALAHAGWVDAPDNALFADVNFQDRPGPDDKVSAHVVEAVARWHIDNDDEIPDDVRKQLVSLIDQRMYTTAIAYFFDNVWDRDWEADEK